MINGIYCLILVLMISCSITNTSKKTLGSFHIIEKYEKELNGGIELKVKAIYYDSSLAGSVKVILDDKYIYFTDSLGNLKINLSKKSCLSIRAYSIGLMVCNLDNVCVDSNQYIQAIMNLEWP